MESMQNKKVWFITGVSSGFGRVLAEELVRQGIPIAGTLRRPSQVDSFNQEWGHKALAVRMDVTRPEEIEKGVAEVMKKFGRIDVFVNNAGYGLLGAIEEISLHEAKDQMETNFFGALRVTQEIVPIMRKQKSGHIFQISSVAGIRASAGLGLYNASKFALEGFSEALAQELKPFGVRVTLVEPGPFRTKFADSSLRRAHVRMADYKHTAGLTEERILMNNGKQTGNPQRLADVLIRISEQQEPPLRLPLGKFAMDGTRQKIESLQKDLNACEKISLSTDDPI